MKVKNLLKRQLQGIKESECIISENKGIMYDGNSSSVSWGVFAGCSMSQGSNSLLGNGSSNESESYAEHLENNNISVAGNLGTAESVNVDKITSKKRYIQRYALLCTMIKLSISNCAT